MDQEAGKRADLIIAGLGGQGILMGGKILADASLSQYRNSLWLPSYGSRVRGGPSECTVIYSDNDIDSPVLTTADAVILVSSMLFKLFENRVSAGGYFIVERAGLFDTLQRDDIKLVTVPALGMALEMGERRASNMVLLGVYIGITHSISAPFVEGEIEKRFSAKEKALSLNLNAFRKGLAEAPKLVA